MRAIASRERGARASRSVEPSSWAWGTRRRIESKACCLGTGGCCACGWCSRRARSRAAYGRRQWRRDVGESHEARAQHPECPALVAPPRRAAVRHVTASAMAAATPENVRHRHPRVLEVQGPSSDHRSGRRAGRRAPGPGTARLSSRRSAAGPRPRSDDPPRRRARRRLASEPRRPLARPGPRAVWTCSTGPRFRSA